MSGRIRENDPIVVNAHLTPVQIKYRTSAKGQATRAAYLQSAFCRWKSYLRERRCNEADKEAAMNMYSNGAAVCGWCGQGDIDVLNLDHINNDGYEQRVTRGINPRHFYRWLKLHDYPVGFQVLCANCNWKKKVLCEQAWRAHREAVLRTALEVECDKK